MSNLLFYFQIDVDSPMAYRKPTSTRVKMPTLASIHFGLYAWKQIRTIFSQRRNTKSCSQGLQVMIFNHFKTIRQMFNGPQLFVLQKSFSA